MSHIGWCCVVQTADYKDMLLQMIEREEVEDFTEHHTESTVLFHVTPSPKFEANVKNMADKKAVAAPLKLSGKFALGNMHAFDGNGNIQRYGVYSASVLLVYMCLQIQCAGVNGG